MVSTQLQTLQDRLLKDRLGKTIIQFLDYLTVEAGLSANTRLAYGRDLIHFAMYCKTQHISTLGDIDAKLIYSYLRALSSEKKAETTISRALVAVKMLLRFGVLTGLVSEDFTAIIEGPKRWQKLPVVCNKQKVIDLLDCPTTDDAFYFRDKSLLEMLYATGMRASEVADLKISALNFSIGYLRCLGKGNKERIIPLGKTAIEVTKLYLQDLRPNLVKPASGDFLFLSRTGRAMTRVDIWRVVKKYARRAGLPHNMTVHTLRHCFASHLLSGGADLRSLQEMLGHVDIATTQIYTHVDQDRLKSIHKQYHPRP
ncbi:MAG: site-specific tyrosine recombinase [Planctomycetota bacterium]|jgi:integrase/recombinase XerD